MILHATSILVRDHHQTHRTHIEPIGGLGLALLGDGGRQWLEGEQREREKSERERERDVGDKVERVGESGADEREKE